VPSQTFTASGSWTVPANAVPGSVQVYAIGESGNAGTSVHGSTPGAGSGGGACGGEPSLGGLTPGTTVLTLTIPQGGTGNPTTVTGGSVTVQGNAGGSATGTSPGSGGAAGTNTVAFRGGNGASNSGSASPGGGGGGSAGSTGPGGDASGATGGAAGTGAAGPPSLAGAAGASGPGSLSAGTNGTAPGGGASGGGSGGSVNHTGGTGAPGQVIIIWQVFTFGFAGTGKGTGTFTGTIHKTGSFKGYTSGWMAPPVRVVNAWSGTFAQPAVFGNMPPALQSVVVPLTPAGSLGLGTGTPSAGNWLFCVSGLNEQSATSEATVAVSDDVHDFWRPGDETTSTWAVSQAAALTRTSGWYTPNLKRIPSAVYAAPNGCLDAQSVMVIEVTGLGPWDTVTGIYTSYAAAVTSLTLALPAPSAPVFLLAAACGDSAAAGQQLTPAGWNTLPPVSASNGVDHACDAVLTTAWTTGSSAVSVNATAASATDLSGVVIGVLQNAPSPIPAGANPAWAGRFIVEIGLGSGFQTPPDQVTWTKVTDNEWPGTYVPGSGTVKRAWTWSDSGGIQYGLGGLQSGEGTSQWDNADGYLTPSNSSSPLYPDVTTGTPVRIRAALGTIGGKTVNSWYVVQRNALKFTEKRTKGLRSFIEAGLTDIYSVFSAPCPSPYRGEVYQDNPHMWIPCDDQPVSGGVLPTQLRNAAEGTGLPLQIVPSPNGVSGQDGYSSSGAWTSISGSNPGADGTDLTALLNVVGTSVPPPSVAVYSVAADSGWMYGDPQSSPGIQAGGGPVTAQPGAAAWQQSGASGNTGSNGWFLACHDPSFPPLSGGITVESWFNYAYFRTAAGVNNAGTFYGETGQPYCPLTLWELATDTGPVCLLQLDLSGHLVFTTYNGTTPTSTTVYNSSDLRCNAWVNYTVVMNQGSWTVYVNAGLTAKATGSGAGMTSAWTWFIGNGDLGTSGGTNLAAIQHGGNCEASHIAIYPQMLPAYRILAHYNAALTGFGLIPAPTSPQIAATQNISATGFTPDGSEYKGQYGFQSGAHPATTYTMSAVAAAVAGAYTSGPSARAVSAGFGNPGGYANALYTSWTSAAPLVQVFTAASADAETEAAAVLGAGDTFTGGFGSGATGTGPAQVSAGTGASPPAAPTPLGDLAGERIERILAYGNVPYPGRSIDQDPAMVQAAIDIQGQAAAQNLDNIRQSVTGLLSVDGNGNLCFRDRARLAADTPAWALGPDVGAGQIPYDASQSFSNDPQRIWNLIRITPYAPDGATLATITPSSFSAALASQEQFGARPLPFTSYLQSTAEMQVQADWLLSQYGGPLRRRVSGLKIDAARHPAAWPAVLGMNVGDLATVTDMPFGPPVTTGTYRVTSISRSIAFGGNDSAAEASLTIALDFEPSTYYS